MVRDKVRDIGFVIHDEDLLFFHGKRIAVLRVKPSACQWIWTASPNCHMKFAEALTVGGESFTFGRRFLQAPGQDHQNGHVRRVHAADPTGLAESVGAELL